MDLTASNNDVLDLTNKKLKKFNKYTPQESQNITALIVDENDLQRLENLDSFVRLQKLSVAKNQLLRMYGVGRLYSLHTLNLSNNGILTIEGLKELVNLKWLCLAGNSIKTIEHLNTNTALEHIDLSLNNISHVNDLSYLKNLKELLLHNNKINHLRQCERFLPTSLTILTLANNNVEDLNEICQLVHLINLNSISIANNPCVNPNFNTIGFDYRPFVINWCLNIKTIDGYVVDAIESLRAEWLYSQGRGRHFRIGDHKELVQYLASVCPLTGETLETEEDRKLRIILSKAQHHQQQLREQGSESPIPSPSTRKKILNSSRNSPRLNSARGKVKSPDRMASSVYSATSINSSMDSTVMSQSFDPSMLRKAKQNNSTIIGNDEPINSPLQALSKMMPVPESLMSPDYRPASILTTLQTPQTPNNKQMQSMLATPINNKINKTQCTMIRSPKSSPKSGRHSNLRSKLLNDDDGKEGRRASTPSPRQGRKIVQPASNPPNKASILRKSSSSDDESEILMSKLSMIQMKAEEKRQQKDAEIVSNNSSSTEDKVEQAAVCIQKIWRGYFARNRNKEVQEVFKTIQAQRADQYIEQLTSDMETTKAALESERKIQMLQTEAISALWKQMSALQPGTGSNPDRNSPNEGGGNENVVKELTKTCSVLQNQIEQLQSSMKEIIKVMTVFQPGQNNASDKVMATQTEIVAVHTPQGEASKAFPFQKQSRPSSLPLPVAQRRKSNSQSNDGSGLDETNSEIQEFADNLVHGVIKTVSETKTDSIGDISAEIIVTDCDKVNGD